jgi:hypothetical protein
MHRHRRCDVMCKGSIGMKVYHVTHASEHMERRRRNVLEETLSELTSS